MNARNLIENGAALPLYDVSVGDRTAGEENMDLPSVMFNGDDVANQFLKLLSNKSYTDATKVMKVAAIASGGGDRAEKAIRDYYVQSLLNKPGKTIGDHLVDSDWLYYSRKAGPCKCCCGFLFLILLIVFLAVWGFPGLLHTD